VVVKRHEVELFVCVKMMAGRKLRRMDGWTDDSEPSTPNPNLVGVTLVTTFRSIFSLLMMSNNGEE
jgi:hypothetical protein